MLKAFASVTLTLLSAATLAQSRAPDMIRMSKGSDKNMIRQLDRVEAQSQEPDQQKAQKIEYILTIGGAYERASGDERTWNTPLLFGATAGPWYAEVSGDGYLRSTAGGQRSEGLADIALLASYTFTFGAKDAYGLAPEIEWDVPTHGEVGSRRASQAVRLKASRKLSLWNMAGTAGVERSGDTEPDTSRYARTLKLEIGYQYGKTRSDVVGLKAKHVSQNGVADKTALRAEWDFLVPKSTSWTGALTLGHDRQGARRASLVEFDLSYEF